MPSSFVFFENSLTDQNNLAGKLLFSLPTLIPPQSELHTNLVAELANSDAIVRPEYASSLLDFSEENFAVAGARNHQPDDF